MVTAAEFVEPAAEFLARPDGVKIACRYQASKAGKPALLFLPGYMSDMQGGKAQALASWAKENGCPMLRLDYSGCGESGGDFADGTLSQWRDDALLAAGHYLDGPVILIGSSMGGWLMLLIAMALGGRVAGIVGIAPAPDFTDWGINTQQREEMEAHGVSYQDNPYGPEPTPTYQKFVADSAAHILMTGEIAIDCPVRLLHGQCDPDVPWGISLQLAKTLRSDDVQIRLIKDGDHRLSRPQDIDILIEMVAALAQPNA